VLLEPPSASRFNGFPPRGKPLKRLIVDGFAGTGLKSGVNEMSYNIFGNALAVYFGSGVSAFGFRRLGVFRGSLPKKHGFYHELRETTKN